MSTRCHIAVVNPDRSADVIFCQLDGYPQGVGVQLTENYNDYGKAHALMALGDVDSLRESLEETAAYRFGDGHQAKHWKRYRIDLVTRRAWKSDAEYLYIFNECKWRTFNVCQWKVGAPTEFSLAYALLKG